MIVRLAAEANVATPILKLQLLYLVGSTLAEWEVPGGRYLLAHQRSIARLVPALKEASHSSHYIYIHVYMIYTCTYILYIYPNFLTSC